MGLVTGTLPDFPWDTLVPYKDRARRHPDGLVDLSYVTASYTPARHILPLMPELPGSGDTALANSVAYSRIHWKYFQQVGEYKGVKLLGVFTQLSGNVVISYYLADALKLIGYTNPDFQAKYNLGNQVWSLVCGIAAALVIMRFKRRTMYLVGILSILAVYVAWTVCSAVVNATHDLVGAGSVTVEQLGDHPFIFFDRNSSYYSLAQGMFRQHGVVPRLPST